jgi:HAD superfamily hydrolase (TIGR01509 family)
MTLPSTNGRYRALLSDLGGVLLVITEDRFRSTAALFGLTREELYRALYSSLAWRQLEVGNIDIREYWRRVVLQTPSLGDTSYELMEGLLFGEDWGVDREMLAVYESLRRNFQLGILSNHHVGIRQVLESQGIAPLFHDIVISAEVKVAKPNEAAFRLAIERLGAKAHETVFIDDNADNVWTARSLGMAAIEHVSTAKTLAALRAFFPGLGAP